MAPVTRSDLVNSSRKWVSPEVLKLFMAAGAVVSSPALFFALGGAFHQALIFVVIGVVLSAVAWLPFGLLAAAVDGHQAVKAVIDERRLLRARKWERKAGSLSLPKTAPVGGLAVAPTRGALSSARPREAQVTPRPQSRDR